MDEPTPIAQSSAMGRKAWLIPLCVFLAGACLTVVVARNHVASDATAKREVFKAQAKQVTEQLAHRLKIHEQFLHTLAAYFGSHQELGIAAWRRFTERLGSEENLPGVVNFGYATRVANRDIPVFEEKISRDTATAFKVSPAPMPESGEAFAVTIAAPGRVAGSEKALGFDLASQADRRNALELAVFSGDTAITAPITLVLDSHPGKRGFLMIYPVYRTGLAPRSPEERRKATIGVAYVSYRIDELAAPFLAAIPEISVTIADVSDSRALPLLGTVSDGVQAENTTERLSFGHRSWSIHFRDRTAGHTGLDDDYFPIVPGGLALAGLLAFAIFLLLSQKHRAEEYANVVTRNLRTAEAALIASDKFKQEILDAATEISIIATSTQGTITLFNRGAEKMLGHDARNVVGRHTPALFHDADEVMVRGIALSEELRTPTAGFDVFTAVPDRLGHETRDWTYIRSDGKRLRVNLRVTAQRGASGEVNGYLGVAVDVSERVQAEDELREHRDHLQDLVTARTAELQEALRLADEANRAKSDFLANMSHELRTPMHAILSFGALGRDRASVNGDEKSHQYFERIRQSAQRLLGLVNELLDLARLETHQSGPSFENVDAHQLAARVAAHLESLALARKIQLNMANHSDSAEIEADSAQIERLMHNLLSNAIKFSPERGKIDISFAEATLSHEGGEAALAIAVSDCGPGIPSDELDAVFEKFVQSSRTRSGAGGTGLGLAICREIASAHRGTISAANNPAEGATLTVILPRKQ